MYILTMQDKSILEEPKRVIRPTGSSFLAQSKLCESRMESDYRKQTGKNTEHLFWGFLRINGKPLELNDTSITQFLRIQECATLKDQVLLLVDVPAEELFMTNYDEYRVQVAKCEKFAFEGKFMYNDEEKNRIQELITEFPSIIEDIEAENPLLYEEEPERNYLIDDWKRIYELQRIDNVQVVFPRIKQSWIVSSIPFNATRRRKKQNDKKKDRL